MVRTEFGAEPTVHCIQSGIDDGWVGGVHKGMPAVLNCGYDWVWMLNDDSLPHPTALERLLCSSAAHQPSTVALAPKAEDRSHTVQPSHGYFSRRSFLLSVKLYPLLSYLTPEQYLSGETGVDWSTGFGLLVRTTAIDVAGLPRKEFFFWFDDVEWTLRLAQVGRIWVIPSAVVVDNYSAVWPDSARNRMLNLLFKTGRRRVPLDEYWKAIHGFRNYAWIAKHYAHEPLVAFSLRLIAAVVLTILCDDRPALRLWWLIRFALQGRTGRFRNISPQRWMRLVRGRSSLTLHC
jgi:GT2 family glycosyltransferase